MHGQSRGHRTGATTPVPHVDFLKMNMNSKASKPIANFNVIGSLLKNFRPPLFHARGAAGGVYTAWRPTGGLSIELLSLPFFPSPSLFSLFSLFSFGRHRAAVATDSISAASTSFSPLLSLSLPLFPFHSLFSSFLIHSFVSLSVRTNPVQYRSIPTSAASQLVPVLKTLMVTIT